MIGYVTLGTNRYEDAAKFYDELLGIIGDENSPNIELDAMALFTVPQVERGLGRDVKQGDVFHLAFHPVVDGYGRGLGVVGGRGVEIVVLLFGDVVLGPGPQRGSFVNHFPFRLLVLFGFAIFVEFGFPEHLDRE